MFTIAKRFDFSAGHHLEHMPDGHPCANPHGHNYVVEVELKSGVLDGRGFIIDYGELKPLKEFIDQTLDHKYLNDVLDFQPSAESLAKYLFDWCKGQWDQVVAVKVSETAKTWAEYRE